MRGLIGTVSLMLSSTMNILLNLKPSRKRAIELYLREENEFDRKYNVNTSGDVSQDQLSVNSENQVFATKYQPIQNIDFSQILKELNLDYSNISFIDFGSGKGRAILLASALKFKKIIGIEFSELLNNIAKENIKKYCGKKLCDNFELICMDAAKYSIPIDDNLVLFFYNPFSQLVMEKVAHNIINSFQQKPRRIVIIYFEPVYQNAFNNISFLTKIKVNEKLCIYDSNNYFN